MIRGITAACVVAAVIGWAAPAAAGDIVSLEATGESTAGSPDSRQQALDRAFASAVMNALADELTKSQYRKHQKDIERQIVRHARRYIASFTERESETIEGRFRIRIAVKLDRAHLRKSLSELGIDDGGGDPGVRPAAGGRPKVVVLLRATVGTGVEVTFGSRGSTSGPIAKAFVKELTEQGFAVADATGDAPPVSRSPADGAPVDDAAAIALARKVGAGGAFVVGVRAGAAGRIRGTSNVGATATATVRVIDVSKGAVVASTKTTRAGYADKPDAAAIDASRRAVARASQAIAGRVAKHWPVHKRTSDDATLVVVRGAERWATITALVGRVRVLPGVTDVALRRFAASEVVLAVTTSGTVGRLAEDVGRTALPLGSVTARASGDIVEVTVDGDAEGHD